MYHYFASVHLCSYIHVFDMHMHMHMMYQYIFTVSRTILSFIFSLNVYIVISIFHGSHPDLTEHGVVLTCGEGDARAHDIPVYIYCFKNYIIIYVYIVISVFHGSHPDLTEHGVVLTCGEGDVGQLGLGEEIFERSRPAKVDINGEEIVSVAAGGMHTVCLTKKGEVCEILTKT